MRWPSTLWSDVFDPCAQAQLALWLGCFRQQSWQNLPSPGAGVEVFLAAAAAVVVVLLLVEDMVMSWRLKGFVCGDRATGK
jgi:hypothetical protein